VRRAPAVTDRGRTVSVAVVLAAVAALVPLLVWRGADILRTSTAGRVEETVRLRPRPLPDTPATLVVLLERSEPVGLLVVARSPSGSTLLPLPVASATVLEADGEEMPLGAAWAAGGLDAMATAVAGLLEVELQGQVTLDEAALVEYLRPAAPLEVTLPSEVRDADADGRVRVLQPAGTRRLGAAEAAQVLLARVPGEPELARVGRVAAVWTAVAASIGGQTPSATSSVVSPTVASSVSPGPDAGAGLSGLRSGPVRVHLVPVVADVPAAQRPAGVAELLRLDPDDVRLIVAEALPGAASPAGGGVRVRLVDPIGDRVLRKAAVARLTPLGIDVVLVQEVPQTPPAATRIEFDDADLRPILERSVDVLGSVAVVPLSESIVGVQATIVLGAPFIGLVADERSSSSTAPPATTTGPTTTSTTTTSTTTTLRRP
jgi:hypothetical protein